MTDQEGDRLFFLNRGIQGGLEKWSVARGKAEVIFPDPPESRESNSIPVTRGISHYLFYYTFIMAKLN